MTTFRLLLNSLFFYWRTNLAVLLGVVAGTAVIGGALLVGDSVRYSLQRMTLDRLGNVDHALSGGRFFREQLADDIARHPEFTRRFARIAPALSLVGSLEAEDSAGEAHGSQSAGLAVRRAGNVNVYGLDERLWAMLEHGKIPLPTGNEVILNARTANELQASAGDAVTLWIEPPATIPRESLLGHRDESAVEIALTVKAILPESSGAGRFALQPNQQAPRVVFVALERLQEALNLGEVRPTRRDPTQRPARVNSLFIQARSPEETDDEAARQLTELLHQSLTLDDLNLRLVSVEDRGYLSLESRQMILETALADAGRAAADELGWTHSEVLAYLANSLTNAENPDAYSMYSIIAGIDPAAMEPPFGPFEMVEGPGSRVEGQTAESGERRAESQTNQQSDSRPSTLNPQPPSAQLSTLNSQLADRGILVNEWLASDLKVAQGDAVRVAYHVVGSHGELPEKVVTFRVAGVVKLTGPAADRGLTPEVRGITDVESLDEWDQPFPMDLDRVTPRDDEYWEQYRATPKAFVSLDTAKELWSSRYGSLTSLRVAPKRAESQTNPPLNPQPSSSQLSTRDAQLFADALLKHVDPAAVGLVVQPVKSQGLAAASGTTDFSGLFLGFSFFLILAAVILVGLLFRLGIERRSSNLGLLSAIGFTPAQVRGLVLCEGLVIALLGGLLGMAAAVGYAALMLYGLKTWWIGAIGTKFLFLDVRLVSLLIGFAGTIAVAMLAMWWAVRRTRSLSTRELLSGTTSPELSEAAQKRRGRRSLRAASVLLVASVVLIVGAITGLIPASEAFFGLSWQVVAFFIVGVSLLTASLLFLAGWLDADRSIAVRGRGIAALGRLGMRNASRSRQRSVLTVALIASATFVIAAVAAGQRNPTEERPRFDSGNGGFTFVAETSVPILFDLNSPDGRDKLNLRPTAEQEQLLNQADVYAFRVKPGEDASCLNLYQTHVPTILGVPRRLIERGGFKFVGADRENPWTLLNEKPADGSIPVLGDMNSLMYSLHKGIGDTIPIPNAEQPDHILRIAGMLDGSIFQGVLLMSEENFLRLYPEVSGYRWFLIALEDSDEIRREGAKEREGQRGLTDELAVYLETGLEPYGFDVDRVADRLAGFLAVQNTYLSTFMTLGGLGLLLGTLGLATVMLRNVLERRAELALLRAVGFRNGGIALLVIWENAFLLLWGLVAGTVSALLAMLPHLTSIGADVPWGSGGLLLAAVFVIGMTAALLAVRAAVRTPIVATLRAE